MTLLTRRPHRTNVAPTSNTADFILLQYKPMLSWQKAAATAGSWYMEQAGLDNSQAYVDSNLTKVSRKLSSRH